MPDDAPEFYDPAEDGPRRSPREICARCGYAPVPPSGLDDRQLPGRLWELLYAAAARRFFFCSTNHLSDRELYTLLWEQWLDEPTADIPIEAETNTNMPAGKNAPNTRASGRTIKCRRNKSCHSIGTGACPKDRSELRANSTNRSFSIRAASDTF